ncbi:hypothetical protein DLAC_09137 [Tieghemostelium lacteum]|uniref:Uncharacterized protein n=1 Tax=Tieghemostelium lacteum TaxID=361077 RepID=A0A151Z974_TIELA|nr:hypothetical protein DLAC_09137 [Tieghemostelium lacteum]|eukprot:KYQ90510.1 hypothetical protein DLAC_09137 [Tieghemostelium lacteum]
MIYSKFKAITVCAVALSLVGSAMGQTQSVSYPSTIDPTYMNNMFSNFNSLYGITYPDQVASTSSFNTLNSRAVSNGQYNMQRSATGYRRGINVYSGTPYDTMAAGHLGGNYQGLQNFNGTNQYESDHKIRGGALAGIIVGSVIGGLLVIAGLISAFLAWRAHEKRRRSTLYADYRSNYRPEPKDSLKDHVPGEYYRESHRQMITPVYSKEALASSEYRKDHQITYRDGTKQTETVIPRPNNNNEFYNQQDHYENPPHLYRR